MDTSRPCGRSVGPGPFQRASLGLVLAGLLLIQAERLPAAEVLLPIRFDGEDLNLPMEEVAADPHFVYPGSRLSSRDLLFRADRLERAERDRPSALPEVRRKRFLTRDLLVAARFEWPQAVRFRLDATSGMLHVRPVDAPLPVRDRRSYRADVAVVGGELESVVAAMIAADAGFRVLLLYAGPLGGLSSDAGGNLRYFDGSQTAPRPAAQRRLMHEGLGMTTDNLWALPDSVSARLQQYLEKRYGARIRVLPTRSYNSLLVEREGGGISGIQTEEGAWIRADRYLDTDPEARLSEKAGLSLDLETPSLAAGLVFNVQGLALEGWRRLDSFHRRSPGEIASLAGAAASPAPGKPTTEALEKLRRVRSRDRPRRTRHTAYGYSTLGEAFHLFMLSKAERLAEREGPGRRLAAIRSLNEVRVTSGFNVSLNGSPAFNSLSYRFPVPLLQHDHEISEERFRAFREVEGPGIQEFLRRVTGNPGLVVRLPRQFYVRKASAFVRTRWSYSASAFRSGSLSGWWMSYPMDFRGLQPMDRGEAYQLRALFFGGSLGRPAWRCLPETSVTEVSNLWSINKCSVTPRYFGGLRILQNLINTSAALVESWKPTARRG